MKLQYIPILKLLITTLSFICILAYLIVKITSQKFIKQENPLQYTHCQDYVKVKYSYAIIANQIQNVQLILMILLETVMIGKSLYIILKEKPQKIEQITDTKWFKAEFIITSVIIIYSVSIITSLASNVQTQKICDTIDVQNTNIFLPLILSVLLLKLFLTGINFYLNSKYHSQLDLLISSSTSSFQDTSQFHKFLQQNQIFKNLQQMENQNIFDMDSKQIRQQLLNQHQLPENQDPMNGFIFGNKFSQFQQNQESKIQRKIRKYKLRQALLNGKKSLLKQKQNNYIQRVIDEKFILGPQDELDAPYDRQKVPQKGKQTIKKLQNEGYIIQERPYIQKIIISKKFDLPKIADAKNANKKNVQNKKQANLNELNQINNNEQEIEIVINLDARQQRAPQQYYTGQDLESIQLDNIFYREYVEKEKREKQQLRLKIFKQQKQKQLQNSLQNSNRLKCSYQKYINEDVFLDRNYEQALQYSSKKHGTSHFAIQELAFHIKSKSIIQLQNKTIQEELKQLLKDKIRIKNTQPNLDSQDKSKRRPTIDSGQPGKYKDRRNPLQIIRGKGAMI